MHNMHRNKRTLQIIPLSRSYNKKAVNRRQEAALLTKTPCLQNPDDQITQKVLSKKTRHTFH